MAGFSRFLTSRKTKIHRILLGRFLILEVHLLKQAFRNVADGEHNWLPLVWNVENIPAFVDRSDDGFGDGVNIGELLALRHRCGHRSARGAGFDGEDGDALAIDAVAQAGEECGEAGL